MLKVSEVSQALGVNPQTLYFYERIGLIPPPQRTDSGYRLFSEQDLQRLRFIIQAKELGLSLNEIKEILALKAGKPLTCYELHNRLVTKLEQIEAQIQQLQSLREDLYPLVEQCRINLDPVNRNKECTVLELSHHDNQMGDHS